MSVFILCFLELALTPSGLEASPGASFICAYEWLWEKQLRILNAMRKPYYYRDTPTCGKQKYIISRIISKTPKVPHMTRNFR